ncbi:nuclear transcription factor Y subunit gamma [Patella vulgata]|uniref:nuclear transcription factor Y subunit gamma n=1 Tax=Patella vulgata TaxID=6465 RepID=UPI00217FC788|nr:nuclear transcription factor Y subunit gamma [Patella vulgata]XP_050402318.1 nuclear transcription factor Y subunit gamma [Patella vulgata]
MAEQFASPAPISGVSLEAQQMLTDFWPKVINKIQNPKENDLKNQELPLARIKKIMKLDEDVKMISAEAPVLFAKAAEIFISEISLRAWIHTEDNKRRTLQRNDIAMAISKFDQFDFLIDIVPRDEMKPAKRQDDTGRANSQSLPDQINYYLQLAQQQAQQQQQTQVAAQPTTQQATQVVQQPQQTAQVQQPQQQATIQLPGGQILQQPFQILGNSGGTTQAGQQIIQIQSPQQQLGQVQVQQVAVPAQQQTIQLQQQQQQQQQQQPQQQQTQVYQQVVTPSGEIQNIPIQLTPQQLQAIQLQIQGKQQTNQQQQIIVQQAQDQTQQSFTTQANQPLLQLQGLPLGQNAQQIFIQQPTSGDVQSGENQQDVS